MKLIRFAALATAVTASTGAVSPRQDPLVRYVLHVDSTDLRGFNVEIRIKNAPDTFRLAMNAHPEYDDKYWRYLGGMRVESPRAGASVVRTDSSTWRVIAPGGTTTVSYRITLPTPQEAPRGAWRPFLAPTGGLLGGPHAFLYILDHTDVSSHVTLDIPHSWNVATGLVPTSDPRTFFAPEVAALMEAPLLAGKLSIWPFDVDGVPHRVAYWWAPNGVPFDTVAFVRGIRGVASEAIALFGHAPWREFTFMFQDAAYGGLEHPNSVTLGAPSAELARNPQAALAEAAHEFFHSWNLMRIHPAEYRTVDVKVQPPSNGLWFSEGLTIFYADLLRRRAGLPTFDSTRANHLATIIGRYLDQPGNSHLSAERVSRAAYNAEPDALGDYSASTHLQGEVIGAMFDFIIRDATDGRRTVDDLMRLMMERYAGQRGFLGPDVERAVEDLCSCDVTPFFDAHVRGGTPIDFARYLTPMGLKMSTIREPGRDRDGTPTVDLGVWAFERASDHTLRAHISDPDNVWGRAGLRTGDRVFSVNGTPVATWPEFRALLRRVKIGDTMALEVEHAGKRATMHVVATQLVHETVRIEPIANASPRAVRLRTAWQVGR